MSALDRGKARVVLASRLPDDPKWATWIDGTLDALEQCIVEDPEIAYIRFAAASMTQATRDALTLLSAIIGILREDES